MAKYIKRLAEADIERKLKSSGAVLVEGPKFCGKTTTALRYAKSSMALISSHAIDFATTQPKSVLKGDCPRVIDEWQTVPELWNEVRAHVDENPGFGQFILTGSSTPVDVTKIHHSGAGRIASVKMRPMSLYESGESNGAVSVAALFSDEDYSFYDENQETELGDIAHYLCRGGWPLSVICEKDVALDVTKNYYGGLFNFEYSENEKFRNKKPELMRMILKSYARNISTEASIQTIRGDVISSNGRTMDTKTLDDYLDALKDLFIIEDAPAWSPRLRSKTAIRTTPTRHFTDTSIATSALGIAPEDLLNDLESFGLFFEDMAVRDLRIYMQSLGGDVLHYRDANGLECDAVLRLENGKWGLCEIKLGGEKRTEEGARNLNRLKKQADDGNCVFSMVLTATGPAYVRSDEIYVVPITCLGP